jgi:acyl-CoA synthetase (AMP-forming)/AMP-acid ligase II/acyl carrier protein
VTIAPLTPLTPAVGFVARLASHGGALAVRTAQEHVSYAELAGRVSAAAAALGRGRRLTLVAAENSLECLTTYLGALSAGHAVLLAPGDRAEHMASLIARYDPDVVARRDGSAWSALQRRSDTAHRLHPDLAMLLTTSGSTGSPKLVRLSHDNLSSNAAAIAEALEIRPTDRAMTSLPLHYCYGLSVVHSHLERGAGLVLTDLSVVDPCFWDLAEAAGATTFAGVPHTFDLLERSGFADRALPTLRYVTQAGGRMPPASVRRYAALGRERGWDLVVMYGQTEATARMAVLPPELAGVRPGCVGRPVPGGSFRVDTGSGAESATGRDADVGELVYSGDNVMLGYAEHPEDLARGRDITELRTGDLGRVGPDGLVEIVGRTSRFAKVVGLRIDLDQVEQDLGAAGLPAHCVDLGSAVGILTPVPGARPQVVATLARRHGIPASGVVVLDGAEPLLLGTGKPDYPAMARLVRTGQEPARGRDGHRVAPVGGPAGSAQAVVALYRQLLERPDAAEDTSFVDLGGDSLSYVEVSLRLEQVLGALPDGWHLRTPADLAAAAAAHRTPDDAPGRRRLRRVETNVLVRAAAVLLILANHTKLADVPGGAHTLLALVGFNLARFQLTARSSRERARGILRSAARIWAPSALWIGAVAVVAGTYDWRNVLMLNQVLGDWARWSDHWHFWFLEAVVALLLGTAALMAVPAVDRWERAHPFAFPVALVGLGLLTRYAVVVPDAGPYRGANAYVLIWLFATGWAAARATCLRHRLLVSAIPVVTLPGFWPTMPEREAVIIAGLLALIWVPTIAVPAWVGRAASVVAAASLFVYLTHFAVYPHVMALNSGLAVLASLVVGVAYWQAWTRLERWAGGSAARLQVLPGVRHVVDGAARLRA